MRILWLIFFFTVLVSRAQDKLVFTNGKIAYGKLLSVSTQSVFFIYQDSSQSSALDRKLVLFLETSQGDIKVFGSREKQASQRDKKKEEPLTNRNIFGGQPLGIFIGRVTLTYERLSKHGDYGLMLPFSLTFDPSAWYVNLNDSSGAPVQPTPGVNFITGLDLNYYLKVNSAMRGFMGPRLRYGTDQLLGGIEGLSFQYQLGWSYWSDSKWVQHLSVGYGFVKILNFPAGSAFYPDQLYGWFSLNYRVSFCR